MSCVVCGLTNDLHRKRYGRILEVHRLLPGSIYTADGCITLCKACHNGCPRALQRRHSSQSLPQQGAEYRDVPGVVGYKVGSDGSLWSCRCRNGRGFSSLWHQLIPVARDSGHLSYSISDDGIMRQLSAHRLVLEVFVGPCPPGMQGCHNDGVPGNNHIENLRWDTPGANQLDKRRHGTMPRGESHVRAKLTIDAVKDILSEFCNGASSRKLARKHSVAKSTILRIVHGDYWQHVVGDGVNPPQRQTECLICGDPVEGLGYCSMHYQRLKRTGDPIKVMTPSRHACSIPCCDRLTHARGLCAPHYMKSKRDGSLPELKK